MTRVQVLKDGFFPLFIVFGLILSSIIIGFISDSEHDTFDLTSRDFSLFVIVVICGSAIFSFSILLLSTFGKN